LLHDLPDRTSVLHQNISGTVAYYKHKLGFECLGTWQDPPVYAMVARDQHAIHSRCAAPPTPDPDKYADELLDAYLQVRAEGQQTAVAVLQYKLSRAPRHVGKSSCELHAVGGVLGIKRVCIFDM